MSQEAATEECLISGDRSPDHSFNEFTSTFREAPHAGCFIDKPGRSIGFHFPNSRRVRILVLFRELWFMGGSWLKIRGFLVGTMGSWRPYSAALRERSNRGWGRSHVHGQIEISRTKCHFEQWNIKSKYELSTQNDLSSKVDCVRRVRRATEIPALHSCWEMSSGLVLAVCNSRNRYSRNVNGPLAHHYPSRS